MPVVLALDWLGATLRFRSVGSEGGIEEDTVLLTRLLKLLFVALVAGSCGGASCLLQGVGPVVIETQLAADGSGGTFTLSGGCGICGEGTVTNVDSTVEDGEYVFWDELVCADGSGSFVLGAQLIGSADGLDRTGSPGEWEVVSGTGDYATLWGSGEYQASSDEPCCSGTYSGEIGEAP